MHPYQIDEQIRVRVFLVAAFLSIVAARAFNLALQNIPFSIPWWLEAPSVLGFFWFFIWLFDNHLWKMRPVQNVRWFHIPNLNGTWVTEIKSSQLGFEKSIQARVIIRQTATRISTSMESDLSISHSVHAALLRTDKLSKFELTYNYMNQPKADSLSTMNIHQGTAWLYVSNDGNTLDGEYYTGRGRQSFGRMTLKRIEV